jgi:hypothetical protein
MYNFETDSPTKIFELSPEVSRKTSESVDSGTGSVKLEVDDLSDPGSDSGIVIDELLTNDGSKLNDFILKADKEEVATF